MRDPRLAILIPTLLGLLGLFACDDGDDRRGGGEGEGEGEGAEGEGAEGEGAEGEGAEGEGAEGEGAEGEGAEGEGAEGEGEGEGAEGEGEGEGAEGEGAEGEGAEGEGSGPLAWLTADDAEPALPAATARTAGPDDWRDEVIYFIVTDRFVDGDPANNEAGLRDDGTPLHDRTKPQRYHGGDLPGILSKIDYLRKLGVTAVWMTPIVENVVEDDGRTGYAGYWTHDFTKVDRHLVPAAAAGSKEAGLAAYRDFVTAMHDAGLLVIQDIVVNHTGNLALYRIGGQEQWDPAYTDNCYGASAHLFVEDSSHAGAPWVTIGLRTKPPAPFDDPTYYHNCGRSDSLPKGDLNGLDDLATEKAEVRTALATIYGDWYASANVDGFRIDTVKHLEEDFWDDFANAIRTKVAASSPARKFLQFGEAYTFSHGEMAKFVTGERLDSLLNFELQPALKSVFAQDGPTSKLTTELANRALLRDGAIARAGSGGVSARDGAVNFLDNHDVARFLDDPKADGTKLFGALTYLYTTLGIPCIYYGTEANLEGITADGEGGRVDLEDYSTTGKRTFALMRRLAAIRKDNVALRRGGMEVMADTDGPGLFAFVRPSPTGNAGEHVFVLLNTGPAPVQPALSVGAWLADGDTVTNLLLASFGGEETVTIADGFLTTTVEAHGMKIFRK
ncbi:MAG: alpha-amylase family glycosyl hydrolase [Myxococcota bacterium]|nr:alpha-amylase family glycosyl hydrolase [Myxococcota bacterium]